MKKQKYTNTRMVTANVIRGYKGHIEELREKMESYNQEISRISSIVENLEDLLSEEEKCNKEITIEDVVKFVSTASEHDKDIIKSVLGVNNMEEDGFYDNADWAIFYKHITQITQHATLPNVTILKHLVEASQGLTQMEVAERIGFLSTAKLIQLNKIIESYGLGRIGLKKERTVHRNKSCKPSYKKASETRKKRIKAMNDMVDMVNELNKR